MPPRMLEQWLDSTDITELQAYYRIRDEDEARRRGAAQAAAQTDAMARKRGG